MHIQDELKKEKRRLEGIKNDQSRAVVLFAKQIQEAEDRGNHARADELRLQRDTHEKK